MLDQECFDAIGFKASDFKDFTRFLDLADEKGFHPQSPRGLYVYWPVGAGIEFWIAFDKQQKPLSFHPHYLGSSRVTVKLLRMIEVESFLSGELHVEVNPRSDGTFDYPLVFQVPSWDYTHSILHEKIPQGTGPAVFTAQITAFANELRCYDSEEAYYTSPAEQKTFSANYFVPTGLFVEGNVPNPSAGFAGRVLQTRVLTNPATAQKTLYLSVQTFGMVIDVVADPKIVKGRPKLGGTVSGQFSLSGRMTAEIDMTNKYFKLT